MYYAPGLLYIHYARTGGTFFADFMEKAKVGGSRQLTMDIGGHDGVRVIPPQVLQNSLVVTTLRDPWSLYCSWDAMYRNKGRFDGFLHQVFGKAVNFKQVVWGLTHPREAGLLRNNKPILWPGARSPDPHMLAQIAESGVGLYTWIALRMFCLEAFESVPGLRQIVEEHGDVPWGVNAVIDTAQLRDGMSQVLHAWRPDLAAQLEDQLRNHPAMNQKANFRGVLPTAKPDPSVYDADMQRWVLEADGWLLHRFGFDQPVGLRPAVTVLPRSG